MSPALKALCNVRKHRSAPSWYVVTVKVPTDENVALAWKALAECNPVQVKTAPGSLRFVKFE